MIVQATYSDGNKKNVTGYTCTPTKLTTAGAQTITVSYTEDSITKTTIFTVTVEVKIYAITLDQNDGTGTKKTVNVTEGEKIGNFLYTPSRDYYTFNGWYSSKISGTKITENTVVDGSVTVIYAQWTEKPASGWVLESNVPSNAKIVDEKWTYDLTETKESTETSLAGYAQTGSYWKQVGSGSKKYANFPSTFDTNHWIYTDFAKGQPYTNSETATTKREVNNVWTGYVYWHWMYNVAYANNTNRTISHRYGTWNPYGGTTGAEAYAYWYFSAFLSSTNCPSLGTGYCCNQGITSYNCSSIISSCVDTSKVGVGTPRYFRFDYYTCNYTDYQKVFKYSKTESKESTTEIKASSSISNVKKWVKYQEK